MESPRPAIRIVGRGAVSCFGAGVEILLENVFAGRTGLVARRRTACAQVQARVAAEVPEALVERAGSAEELPLWMARFAACEALAEAGTDDSASDEPTALVLGTTKGDLSGVVNPSSSGARVPAVPGLGRPHLLAEQLATDLQLRGQLAVLSCACASGLSALALAGRWIEGCVARRVLVVGVDALSPFILEGFGCLAALDAGPCRPFDGDRRGLSLGEGAGAIVLESAPAGSPGMDLAGWGESNDACHVTRPDSQGAGLCLAIERALERSRIARRDVDAVVLHGTGTRFSDAMENRALRRSFASVPPACGVKGQIGHTLGASGLLESLVALECLRRGVLPGCFGLGQLDDDLALDVDPRPRPLARAGVALKHAAGFGGINAALVFRRRSG